MMMSIKEAIERKEEERRLLNAQAQRIKEDRAYGIRLAQQAGILDENEELTSHYKQEDER